MIDMYYEQMRKMAHPNNMYAAPVPEVQMQPYLSQCQMPSGRVEAVAYIRGGPLAPQISGIVYFVNVAGGTDVYVHVTGLPPYRPATNGEDPIGPHGFHIHEFGTCKVSNPEEPFQAAGEHWAPHSQPHGNHAGDFPVLFSNKGMARMSFFTDKFKPLDAVGKTVLIHENPDDYRTQPAGDAGRRLACGVIQRYQVRPYYYY